MPFSIRNYSIKVKQINLPDFLELRESSSSLTARSRVYLFANKSRAVFIIETFARNKSYRSEGRKGARREQKKLLAVHTQKPLQKKNHTKLIRNQTAKIKMYTKD